VADRVLKIFTSPPAFLPLGIAFPNEESRLSRSDGDPDRLSHRRGNGEWATLASDHDPPYSESLSRLGPG